MPLYEFECEKCRHSFEDLHLAASFTLTQPCPVCYATARKVPSASQVYGNVTPTFYPNRGT